jgi:hypothetical protein
MEVKTGKNTKILKEFLINEKVKFRSNRKI